MQHAQTLPESAIKAETCAETIQFILLHELYPFISFLCDQNPGKTCSTLSRSGADSKRVTNGGRVGRRDPSLPTLSQPWVPQLTKGAVAVLICFLIFRNTEALFATAANGSSHIASNHFMICKERCVS